MVTKLFNHLQTADTIKVMLRDPLAPIDSLPRSGDVVPRADDRFVSVLVLVTEHAHAGGAAVEGPAGLRRQAEPSSGDHPDDVRARKCQHVPVDASHTRDEPVGAGGDVRW